MPANTSTSALVARPTPPAPFRCVPFRAVPFSPPTERNKSPSRVCPRERNAPYRHPVQYRTTPACLHKHARSPSACPTPRVAAAARRCLAPHIVAVPTRRALLAPHRAKRECTRCMSSTIPYRNLLYRIAVPCLTVDTHHCTFSPASRAARQPRRCFASPAQAVPPSRPSSTHLLRAV